MGPLVWMWLSLSNPSALQLATDRISRSPPVFSSSPKITATTVCLLLALLHTGSRDSPSCRHAGIQCHTGEYSDAK